MGKINDEKCDKFSLIQKQNGSYALMWMEDDEQNLCLEIHEATNAELIDCAEVKDYILIEFCTADTQLPPQLPTQ